MQLNQLLKVIKPIVSLLLLGYLFFLIDWETLPALLARCHTVYLFYGPMLLTSGVIIASLRWVWVLRRFNLAADLAGAMKGYISCNFYNIFLPGVIGGDIVRTSQYAKKTNSPLSAILKSVVFERVSGLVALFIIGFVFSFLLNHELLRALSPHSVKALLVASSVLLVLFLALPFISSHIFMRMGFRSKFFQTVETFTAAMAQMPACSKFWSIIWSALFQSTDIVTTYFLARALNINLPLQFYFVIMPFIYICTVLPVSMGGVGIREGSFVFLLSRAHIAVSDAVALSFLVYLNRIFFAGICGLIKVWYVDRQ
ncbi:MAG: flippase-like domain-containing protein [bacterium]|nr:flippase-like domain-containing protein [bacterium]